MLSDDYKKWVDENIRLIILKELADDRTGGGSNTFLIQKVLERFSYRKSRDYIRNQFLWLEEQARAVRTIVEGSEISVEITRTGRDHVERRQVLSGVQRPGDAE